MGIPGSGKGTQAERLIAKTGYQHISTGNLLRALDVDPQVDPKYRPLLDIMRSGNLVPDELIYELVFDKIKHTLETGNGVVLDGAVRTVAQAKAYQLFFEKLHMANEVMVVEIRLADEKSFERLVIRKTYDAQGNQVLRKDDDPEIIRKRIASQGNMLIQPILEYYKTLGVVVSVDGDQSMDDVEREIDTVLA